MVPQPAPSLAALGGLPLSPASALSLRHQGFALTVQREPGGAAPFGYSIAHQGLLLHTSGGAFRTPQAADRAARRFVDDALASFDRAFAAEDRAD